MVGTASAECHSDQLKMYGAAEMSPNAPDQVPECSQGSS